MPPGSAGGCRRSPRAIPVGRCRTTGTVPALAPPERPGGSGLAAEEGLAALPRARTANGIGPELTGEGTRTAGSHLGPGGRAGDGPAAARRGLKSPAPPAPPSVRRAHWPQPAPPALAPAPLIGPFESGSRSACSPRAPETAAGPRGGARSAWAGGGARSAADGARPPAAPARAHPARELWRHARPLSRRRRVPREGAVWGCRALYGRSSTWRQAQVLRQPGHAAGPAGNGLKHLGVDGFGFGEDPVTEEWTFSFLWSVSLQSSNSRNG